MKTTALQKQPSNTKLLLSKNQGTQNLFHQMTEWHKIGFIKEPFFINMVIYDVTVNKLRK